MSLKEFFPEYPLILKSPAKAKVKFGTRSLYVDIPWQVYYFLQAAMAKSVKAGLTKEEVKEEWHKFLQYNEDVLIFCGKPFVSVSLRSTPFSEKSFLRLDVKWKLFIEYLDKKAAGFLSEVIEGKGNVMKVYKEIWANFFGMVREIVPPKSTYFPSSRERFRKLLRETGDYFYIVDLLNQFEEMIKRIEDVMKSDVPSVQLYTINLIMDIQHLHALIEVVDVPAAYLLLRNLLENFIKFSVYLNVGKSIDPNIVLYSMFLYEYEAIENRRYSLKGFKNEFVKKFLKIISVYPSDKTFDLFEFINKLKEKRVPVLGVNPRVLEEFSEDYKLNENQTYLDKLYSMCSNIIHNQPPLPFFSLLEVKLFKHFLESYLNSLRAIAEKLVSEKVEVNKMRSVVPLKSKRPPKGCLKVVHKLWIEHDSEIKNAIRKALTEIKGLWIHPLALAAVFDLISLSFTKLRKLSFTQEDLKDVIEKLRPVSFKIALDYEVYETLNVLQKTLYPELEKYEVFSSLKSEEHRNATLFYLLLLYLPEVIEEIVRGNYSVLK